MPPVILEDDLLLPPSLRKRVYRNDDGLRTADVIPASSIPRCQVDDVTSIASASTIEIPRSEYERQPPVVIQNAPTRPVVIHEDHYVPVAVADAEPRYVSPGSMRDIRYRRVGGQREFEMDYTTRGGQHIDVDYSRGPRRRRARSVDYSRYEDGYCSSCDEDEYYDEDRHRFGSRRGSAVASGLGFLGGVAAHPRAHDVYERPQRLPEKQHHHRGRKIAAGAALATAAGVGLHHLRERQRSQSRSSSSERSGRSRSRHRLRHAAELGAAGIAAKKLYDHRSRSRGPREISPTGSTYSRRSSGSHRLRNAAGLAGAGIAAHKLYSRSRSRRRSSSVSSTSSDSSSHKLRNTAGIVGTGIALKKLHDHHQARKAEEEREAMYQRRRSRSMSRPLSRRYSSSSSRSPSHTRRHLAAAAAGATAAGIAAHQYQKRHPRSASVSSYSSDDEGGRRHHHRGRKVAAAGLGAAGLAAAAHHRRRSQSRRRSLSRSSFSSSDDEHHHKGRKAAAATAAGITAAGLAARHHRRNRSSSTSSASSLSSSDDSAGSHHRLRRAATGAAAAAAIHQHRKHRRRSRSRSRPPGILRNGHEGGGRIRRTLSGALNPGTRPRARSVDSGFMRRGRGGYEEDHRRRGLMDGLSRHLQPGEGFVEEGSVHSEDIRGEGGRYGGRGRGGGRLLEGVRRGLESEVGREMAYRVGEGIAEALHTRQSGGRGRR
ncbi:hypothetical protein EX30DRAFT_374528 [Ascodesmis nigricans]|uniref:DUF3824 domain-containing protein n=1 Tax=Ascodesmis nigricans TaxID=341454 RepID=A0A4S2ML48_9PEZI|nr:hypothetical protein EX30DRAFT_374528 [Ascodesmis nigricans]